MNFRLNEKFIFTLVNCLDLMGTIFQRFTHCQDVCLKCWIKIAIAQARDDVVNQRNKVLCCTKKKKQTNIFKKIHKFNEFKYQIIEISLFFLNLFYSTCRYPPIDGRISLI